MFLIFFLAVFLKKMQSADRVENELNWKGKNNQAMNTNLENIFPSPFA
jgi:hypothetical protein